MTDAVTSDDVVCEVCKDKLAKVQKYLNLQTVTEPGIPRKLYS